MTPLLFHLLKKIDRHKKQMEISSSPGVLSNPPGPESRSRRERDVDKKRRLSRVDRRGKKSPGSIVSRADKKKKSISKWSILAFVIDRRLRNGTGRCPRRARRLFPRPENLASVPRLPGDGSPSGATGSQGARRCHRVLTSGNPGVLPADDGQLRAGRSTSARGVDGGDSGCKPHDWTSGGIALARAPAIPRPGAQPTARGVTPRSQERRQGKLCRPPPAIRD